MRICYVVQRYGEDIAGGAEQHMRAFSERLVARGHEVHVATTCATSYVDWADVYEPGDSELNGVRVHRFRVARPRDHEAFGDLHGRLLHAGGAVLLDVQHEWLRLQGPESPALVEWLGEHGPAFDVVVFATYLYWTTCEGLRAVAGLVPTVLHPTAHAEPMLAFSIYDETFRLPDALALSTDEEDELLRDRFGPLPPVDIVGIGVAGATVPAQAIAGFRSRHGLDPDPYLCYVGRIDTAKAVDELVSMFRAYRAAHNERLRLVLVGEPVFQVPTDDDVIVTGFVDQPTRDAALAGALALVHPSYYESFAMVVTEAFAAGRPALVNGRCAVLAGHARRSDAALTYVDDETFGRAVQRLTTEPALVARLGEAGLRYVAREYEWGVVLDRYESLLHGLLRSS
jgi:glycosyltransferase involved in cell wall biosynthesis